MPARATGAAASATGSPTPTPAPARAAIRGSGTGTPASRRSSGAASTPSGRGRELESLLAAHAARRLHRPHDLLGPPALAAAARSSTTSLSRHAEKTGTIQPPLLAWAWRIAVGDPAAEPRIGAQHSGWRDNRDLEGDGLLWIVQPDESGLDSSPKFDPVWGRRAQARSAVSAAGRAQPQLGWDARRIARRRRPGALRGDHQRALVLSLRRSAEPSITAALVERLWDERLGPVPRRGRPAGRPARRSRRSPSLAPLALPDLPEEIGRRLVEEHLLDPERYWPRSRRPRSRPRSRATSPTAATGWCGATGAARPGSTPPG